MKLRWLILVVGPTALGCTAPSGYLAQAVHETKAKQEVAEVTLRELPAKQPEVPLPADYRSWPVFLLDVQRPDSKQVRDIYINQVGATTPQGEPFPNGTLMVMDLFDVEKDDQGELIQGDGGQLVRAALLKTYVMGKDEGWGEFVAPELRNGDWLYSAWANDGVTELTDPLDSCFACHTPLGSSKDWIHRYDEYFEMRDNPPVPEPVPEVPLPADYRSWPVFLKDIQRPDSKQVRDIYINEVGATTEQGAAFPNGTLMVMDLFDVEKDDQGEPIQGDGGQLAKAALLKIYVMGKGEGWGEFVAPELRNGDWLYSAWANDGVTELTDPLDSCFACHTPLGSSKDWIHRYDEYFETRDVP